MPNIWIAIGAMAGGAGVALGAFGAHGLKTRVSPEMLAVFETGVRYHLVHALALLAVGWVADRSPGPWASAAGCLFVAGIAVFSGTLYLMTLGGPRWLGVLTPLGGISFISGWIALAVASGVRH